MILPRSTSTLERVIDNTHIVSRGAKNDTVPKAEAAMVKRVLLARLYAEQVPLLDPLSVIESSHTRRQNTVHECVQ